ncbi:hypothetical protein BB561_006414 [Smittium simulii]|uniref:Uncharacterized protein n=1 Tax=Smittium simulii TaxID=133385 RepID=A0A2T9Y4J9_9FUNG|nr:hypothetical protein BB561_006414 [Smittium simulii]
MKTSLSATAIAAAFLSLSTVKGFLDIFCGRPHQQPDLLSGLQQAGVVGVKCRLGYIGHDCDLYKPEDVAKLSCFLKGKPGMSKQGVFLINDKENTGKLYRVWKIKFVKKEYSKIKSKFNQYAYSTAEANHISNIPA